MKKTGRVHGAAKARVEYILTSKLICDCCGEKMKGVSGKAKNGTVYRYYTCKSLKGGNKCKRKNISKEYIENLVIDTCKLILNDVNINMIAKQIYETGQRENNKTIIIKEYEQQIKSLERAIENLLKAVEKGENIDLINDRINKNREELNQTKILLAKEKNKVLEIDEQRIKFFLSQFQHGNFDDMEFRKKLINIFVNEIHLKEDELMIIFNVSKQKISLPVLQTGKDSICKSFNFTSSYKNIKGSYNDLMVSQEGMHTLKMLKYQQFRVWLMQF